MKLFFLIYRLFFAPAITVVFGIQCRYSETCSHYAERMITERGFLRGTILALRRIISCAPWIKKSGASNHG